jgi:hypothetical protein
MSRTLHRRRSAVLAVGQIRQWDITPPAAVNGTGAETKYTDYVAIPEPHPVGEGVFAAPNVKMEGVGDIDGSIEMWSDDEQLSTNKLANLKSHAVESTGSVSPSASGNITGAGATGTTTGSWAAATIGAYDTRCKYVMSAFSAAVHAYGGIPAAEVTASITSVEIEFADASYNVLKTVNLSCAITSHDIPAGGGIYGETDGTVSLSLASLDLLSAWSGSIAYARMKINWSYDHPFGTGTVTGSATFLKLSSSVAGGQVLKRAVALPTTSVTATGATVTQSFAASVPAAFGVLRFRNVDVDYDYKGVWAAIAPSYGNSKNCGDVSCSTDYLNGSTGVSLTAAAPLTACTSLSSTVKNTRDDGTLVVSSGIEEYYCADDSEIDSERLAVFTGGAEGKTATRLRWAVQQKQANSGAWTGTVSGTKLYQLP